MKNTLVKGWAVALAIAVLGSYCVFVVVIKLTVLQTLAGLPVAAILTYALIRTLIGMPATIKGNRVPKKFKGVRYQLVAMPINHFGEKSRWCMDLIGAKYDEATVAGLLSVFLRGRTVPWLVDRQSCSIIGNSDEILMYLSSVHVPSLTEESAVRANQLLQRTKSTMEWEQRLNLFGHAIQGWAYYYLLAPGVPREFTLFAWGGMDNKVNLFERIVLRTGWPLLRHLIRNGFNHNSKSANDQRYRTIRDVLDGVDRALALSKGPFMFGNHISYVDVTFCALAAPLISSKIIFCQPVSMYANGYYKSFSELLKRSPRLADCWPRELAELETEILKRPCGELVCRMYRDFRSTKL